MQKQPIHFGASIAGWSDAEPNSLIFSFFLNYKLKMALSTKEQDANSKSLLKILLLFIAAILLIIGAAYFLNRGNFLSKCTPSGRACTESKDCCGDLTCNWGMCAAARPSSSPSPSPHGRK